MRIWLKAGGLRFKALVDSGAARSLISSKIINNMKFNSKIHISSEVAVNLFDVNNRPVRTLGTIGLTIELRTDSLFQEFIIAQDISEDCILGVDAIFGHGLIIDGVAKKIYKHVNAKDRIKIDKNITDKVNVKRINDKRNNVKRPQASGKPVAVADDAPVALVEREDQQHAECLIGRNLYTTGSAGFVSENFSGEAPVSRDYCMGAKVDSSTAVNLNVMDIDI